MLQSVQKTPCKNIMPNILPKKTPLLDLTQKSPMLHCSGLMHCKENSKASIYWKSDSLFSIWHYLIEKGFKCLSSRSPITSHHCPPHLKLHRSPHEILLYQKTPHYHHPTSKGKISCTSQQEVFFFFFLRTLIAKSFRQTQPKGVHTGQVQQPCNSTNPEFITSLLLNMFI